MTFSYRDGVLCAEEVVLPVVAEQVRTPFYVYSSARLKENFTQFAAAFQGMDATVHYAIKACPNQSVVKTLAQCGAGADIVSVGEMERALQAGIAPGKIVFSGVGKTDEEIKAALTHSIGQINVESLPELERIAEIALAEKVLAPVAIRVNPDIQASTHAKIATGHKGAKFGVDSHQLDRAMAFIRTNPSLAFKGFTMHVGSALNDYEPFRAAFIRGAELVREWRGKGFTVDRFDCGGGVTIPYDGMQEVTPFDDYAQIVRETLGDTGCALSFEPGRRLVGDAGILLARVIYVKDTPTQRFVVIDAGMNDLIRPAMYGARHSVWPVNQPLDGAMKKASVVGPVCETGDSFGDGFDLPASIKAGDLVAVMQAGAYGSAMGSTYNARALLAEVMVRGNAFAMVRRRVEIQEQMSWETMPPWL